jgi:hypothetical protein
VDVTVVNQAPNTPTITGPSSIDAGENAEFAIIASDPDGDDIYYEVDWDSDGTADAFSASVPSNTSIPANNSWSVVGTTEFQARAIDTAGAQSAWAEHTITISPAATSSTGVPVLEIYSDRTSVRNGEREVINWNTGTTTDLDCIVYGPNFEPIRFNSITDGAVGNRESEPITAKSEFVLSCTDPGGEVYTESLIIEALGSLMEI